MRVLLKDQEDGTLLVMEVVTAAYVPVDHTLFFISPANGDAASVSHISRAEADRTIQALFQTGSADLSAMDAYLFNCKDDHDFCEDCEIPIEAFSSCCVPCSARKAPSKDDLLHVHLHPLR